MRLKNRVMKMIVMLMWNKLRDCIRLWKSVFRCNKKNLFWSNWGLKNKWRLPVESKKITKYISKRWEVSSLVIWARLKKIVMSKISKKIHTDLGSNTYSTNLDILVLRLIHKVRECCRLHLVRFRWQFWLKICKKCKTIYSKLKDLWKC